MKTVKYVPEICKGENPKFSGEVELRLPTFDEKYEYAEKSNIQFNDKGEVETTNKLAQVALIRQFVKVSQAHYISVSLKKIATGEEFKSFEDMSYESDLHETLIEIATQIVNGFKLGNG